VGAAWKATTTVTQGKRAPYRWRNRTRAPADIQPGKFTSHGHHAAVAGDAPERFRGNASSVVQRGSGNAVGRQRILIYMNHDLEAFAAVAGCEVAGQEILGQGHHAIRARGPGRAGR